MDELNTNGNEECTWNIDHPTSLVVLKEFGKIANSVTEEEFLNIMPTTKFRKVKWALMYQYLKRRIVSGMEQEWCDMWKEEQLEDKLVELEKQLEKCVQMGLPEEAWRPITGNITHQLRIHDAIELQKQKTVLSEQLKESEDRIAALKSKLIHKRGYVRAIELDLHQYHERHSKIDENISNEIGKHEKLVAIMNPSNIIKKE